MAVKEFNMAAGAGSVKRVGVGPQRREGSHHMGLVLEKHHNQEDGAGLGLPDLKCQCHQPAVWPWGSYLLPVSFCIVGVKCDGGNACLTGW